MTIRKLFAVLALACATPAAAQTMGYADAVATLARDCGADVARVCPAANLADFEIGRCLDANRAAISPLCAGTLDAVRIALAARAAAQDGIERVCARDIARLCPMTARGDGNVWRCMLKASPSASKGCNAAITAAGWR